MQPIWLAFLAGLTTGGISCLAIQGGLLSSAMGKKQGSMVVGVFLIAKLAAYTILGFLLGLLGSSLTLTPNLMGWVQILAGLFMLATAARLIELHPIFRYAVIQPPRFVYRMLKNQSRQARWFTPIMLGALTILMPCGITQATMAVAVASASPWMGAAIMFAFVLGTSPIFFALGTAFVELLKRKAFTFVAASVILLFGILSINGGLGLMGSFYTIQNLYTIAVTPVDKLAAGTVAGVNNQGVQEVTIDVSNRGYEASATTLKAGVPVRLTLRTNNTRGCVRAFTIPAYNISKVLPETGSETVTFTPQKTGRLAYSCSMGMYTGAFMVQ
jgi:uncharacterized protein